MARGLARRGPDNRWHFTIESEDGTTRLGGDVARDDIVRTAIEAVRTVPGVRGVRSDVKTDAHIAGDRYPYSDDPYGSFPYGYGLAPLGDGARGAVPPSASPGRPTHR